MSDDEQTERSTRVRIGPADEEAQGAGAVLTFTCDYFSAGWRATGRIARGAQGLVISHVELSPVDPEEIGIGITSRTMRAVPVTEIFEQVRYLEELTPEQARALVPGDPDKGEWLRGAVQRAVVGLSYRGDADAPQTADAILAAHAAAAPGPGRAPLPDELLRAVAEGYLAETAPGKPRGAVKRVAAALDRPEQTVSKWVARARRDGWLGPGVVGKEGAVPGPRLLTAQGKPRG